MAAMSGAARSLVTGGAGFIGSHLVDALVEAGDEVAVVDDLSRGSRAQVHDAAVLFDVDVRDGPALRAAFEKVRPERVFHLAAQVSVRAATRDPLHDASVNVIGTVNALEAATSVDARRFVNASTGGAIYGDGAARPSREDHPARPKAPYGQSKLSAEGYCELYRRMHGLATVTLRYSNVYGPRQDPYGEAGVVAIFCGKALAGESPTVFGDGLQTRDYVYVADVVAANLAAADSDGQGVFNIGTGLETSVLELVDLMRPVAAGEFAAQHEPERPGEGRHSALDASRAREVLGWSSAVSVKDGLARTLAWLGSASG
jgi:UDP-glucose 4-epimerase